MIPSSSDLATSLYSVLDHLTASYSNEEFYTEIQKAKEEFFLKAGKVYEDDLEFEPRMCIFMDWYLFERDLSGIDLPPIRHYIRLSKENFSNVEDVVFDDLTKTIHSIFEITKIKNTELFVVDLFTKKKYKIHITPRTPLLTKTEIFEGRVIPFRGDHFLSEGICIHPLEAKKFITKKIKQIRHRDKSQQKNFILELADMKLKFTRFNHIDFKYIYTDHPTQSFLRKKLSSAG